MNCALLTLVGTVTFVVLLVAAMRAQQRCTRWNTVYGTVAKRYNGVLSHATWFSRPGIRLQYGRTVAIVTTLKTRLGDATQVCIEWPYKQFRLEVASANVTGMVRLRLGNEFEGPSGPNKSFHFYSKQVESASRVLSPGVLWQLDRLHSSPAPSDLYVDFSRGSLLIRKMGFMTRVDHLDTFVRCALELFDQAMLTQTEGIEFVNSDNAQLLDNPRCQVCGEPIEGEIVFCSRCRTAHCEECWRYTGVCSTFACGETRYVKPVVAKPIVSAPSANSDSASTEP